MAWTQDDLDKLLKNGASGVRVITNGNPASATPKQPEKEKGKGRYPNVKKEIDPEDGTLIHSRLETKHRKEYRMLLRTGKIKVYSRQPEFILAGGVKWIGDHLIIHLDGSMEIVDSKGHETDEFKIKMKLMSEAHPNIKVTIRSK